MTATNHVMTGAVLAAAIPNPIILPVALASHLILDAVPHWGNIPLNSRKFQHVLTGDIAIASSIIITLFLLRLPHWQLMIGAGVVAASPDLLSIPRYYRMLTTGVDSISRKWPISLLHNIQRYERTNGWIYELIWFGIMIIMFGWFSSRLLFAI